MNEMRETHVTRRVAAALRGELGEVTICDHLQTNELAWAWLDSPTALMCDACAGAMLHVRARVDEGLCDACGERPAEILVHAVDRAPGPQLVVYGQACWRCAMTDEQRTERARQQADAQAEEVRS